MLKEKEKGEWDTTRVWKREDKRYLEGERRDLGRDKLRERERSKKRKETGESRRE